MKIRIGHLSTFYHTAILLMADEKLQKTLGVDVEWRLFGTGPAIVDAFEKGELDIAYIGLPPALIGIGRGVEITCIAGGHMEGTVISGKGRLRGFPEIQDLGALLAQFRGKKIGVPGKGSIHDVILSDCLGRYNLAADTEVVHFRWADELTEAVVRDEVSAAFGTPALAAAVRRYAGGKVLYPPSLLWPNNPSYGILAGKSFLRDSGEIAERFLRQHEMATAMLRDKQRGAANIISRFVGIAEEDLVLDAITISPKYCAKLTGEYISSTMAFARVMKSLGYIRREISRQEIFDTALIDKIHPEKGHYNSGGNQGGDAG
ncbi:MAG: ABC transporter substrate-binding protein [Nitrospirota bacterium]|nr:ABC transporter substrate-binding protein [Nitrospirota bacterium]